MEDVKKTKLATSKTSEEKMNLHSFIKVKGYSVGVEHRIQRQLMDANIETTLQEWESVYQQAMNRKTK